MYYKRLCKTLNNKGILIPCTDNPFDYIDDQNMDYYLSLFDYTEQQLEKFQKEGTVAGVKDVTTTVLLWDFDNENNLEDARIDAVALSTRLIKHGINQKDIRIYFSGKKGFCVQIDIDKRLNVQEFKNICFSLANGLKFDTKIYNSNRIIRLKGTKHQDTGLYKFPLTFGQLTTFNIEDILKLAQDINNVNPEDFNIELSVLPTTIFDLKNKLVIEKEHEIEIKVIRDTNDLDWSKKPKWLTNCKFALEYGFFEEGMRSHALTCLAATYKNQGLDKAHTYRLLKAVAEMQAERNKTERFSDEELWNNVLGQVYHDNWNDGQYTCKEPGWLQDYCNSLGEHKCKHDSEEENLQPRTLMDIYPKFKDMVVNIDENIIKTGIKSIDDNLFITTNSNVLLLGASGCHDKNTNIVMFDGSLKNVQDIKVGDLLMGPDSKPREVLKLCRGKEEMIKIIPNMGNSFIVNKSHIIHLVPCLKKANRGHLNLNIKVDEYINKSTKCFKNYYKLKLQGIELPEKELFIEPYILGLWLGDGTRTKPDLTTMDLEIENEWKNFAKKLGLSIRKQEQINNKSSIFTIKSEDRNNIFWKEFKKLKLNEEKHIPEIYFQSSRKQRLELLAGLLDTDGHLTRETSFDIIQKSKRLSFDIVRLARSLGFSASINGTIKGCLYKGQYKVGNYFRIYIGGNCEEIPCRLERKKAKKRKMVLDHSHIGFKYEILPEDDYYGFILDEDHLYLTDDFIIHHNSGKTSLVIDVLNATSKSGIPSVFASFDMAQTRLLEKICYRVTGFEREKVYETIASNKDNIFLEKFQEEFGNMQLMAKSCPKVSEIKTYVKNCEQKSGKKIKLVVIDYFERIFGEHSDETANSKRISGELHDLIEDLGVCLLTIVQPNKSSLAQGVEAPLWDYTAIKGSGSIYQDARQILSCWRPFYNPKDFSKDKYMEIAVLKNDLGELNHFIFKWNGKRGMINELDEHSKTEYEQWIKEKQEENSDRDNWGKKKKSW